ncbi:hypothetical protein NHQ30_000001 [Ciborinia camelliae]|nr:hypothetical protein NHQ30_000001 [Ciborinia camelliae]
MVKFTSIALFLIASVVSVQACTYCQCLFPNGKHCCVYQNSKIGNLDCTTWCRKARRADGTQVNINNVIHWGTACDTKGSYKCASFFASGVRAPCYDM